MGVVDLFVQFAGEDIKTVTFTSALGTFLLAYGRDVIGVKQVNPTDGFTGEIMADTAEMKRLAQAILDVPDFKG